MIRVHFRFILNNLKKHMDPLNFANVLLHLSEEIAGLQLLDNSHESTPLTTKKLRSSFRAARDYFSKKK